MHRIDSAGTFHAPDGMPTYCEQLRVPALSVGTYSLPIGANDSQGPHTEDEIYVILGGRASLWTPAATEPVTPGDVLFVPAGEDHRFVDVVEDLRVLVVFGPAEYTNQPAQNDDGSASDLDPEHRDHG
jgi:uncharacterized RmlC-like cupin family protein